jgi:hypothetical protein
MVRVNHARRSRNGRQNITMSDELSFQISKEANFLNYEANFQKCYHQYSKIYVIRNKRDRYLRYRKIK